VVHDPGHDQLREDEERTQQDVHTQRVARRRRAG
jgi:hypothetical protein